MSVYTPPSLSAVDFALTAVTPASMTPAGMALSIYTVPSLSAVGFALATYTAATRPYAGWELLPASPPSGFLAVWASQVSRVVGAGVH